MNKVNVFNFYLKLLEIKLYVCFEFFFIQISLYV